MSNTPDLPSTSDEAGALGAEIPALGGANGRPVNKKLIMIFVVVFILIAIAIAFVMSKITNRNSTKVVAPEAQQIIAFPAQRERLVQAPVPTQPVSLKPEQPTQGAAGLLPSETTPGAIPLASEKGAGAVQTKILLPEQEGLAPSAVKSQNFSLADKRSKMGGELMMEGGQSGVNSPEITQNDMAWKKRLLSTGENGDDRSVDSKKPAAGPTGGATGMVGALTAAMSGVRGGGDEVDGVEQLGKSVLNNLNKSSNAVEAQRLATDRNYLIPRGSNITCVLDSRIVSDLSGQTSCTVNRNVYSMNGTYRLIPKGSRLSGAYGGGAGANDRLSVIWDRILTPEGIDVSIAEPGTDAMGATGIPGEFDGHWVKKLSTAILVSLAGDLFKLGSIKYGPKQEITRLEPLGGKTTEIKPYESIAVDILSKVPAEIAAKTLATPGTVTVQQGQMINIMTTRDIDFRQAKAGL